jgi:hypothetical protein
MFPPVFILWALFATMSVAFESPGLAVKLAEIQSKSLPVPTPGCVYGRWQECR